MSKGERNGNGSDREERSRGGDGGDGREVEKLR